MRSQQLVLKFQDKDSTSSVSRKTLKLMAATLGLDEIQLVHYALARLRKEVMRASPVMRRSFQLTR